MIINYNVSGSDRKQLVAAIAEHTGEKAKYLGAPGFAYQIGGFTVSVDGKVTIEDNSTAAPLIHFLREKGFQAEDPLADCIADDANEGVEADEACGICISMPRSLFTESNLENLGTLTKYCVIVVSTLPIIAVYPFLQKYFIKGVMIGAVKG